MNTTEPTLPDDLLDIMDEIYEHLDRIDSLLALMGQTLTDATRHTGPTA